MRVKITVKTPTDRIQVRMPKDYIVCRNGLCLQEMNPRRPFEGDFYLSGNWVFFHSALKPGDVIRIYGEERR